MRFKIDWASLKVRREFTVFDLFCFVFKGNFQVQVPRGAYIRRGDLTEGFCVTSLGSLYLESLIHEWTYFWNFTVANRLYMYFRTKPTGTNIAGPKRNALYLSVNVFSTTN